MSMKGYYVKGKAVQIPDPGQLGTVDGRAIAKMSALLMPYSKDRSSHVKKHQSMEKPTDHEIADFLSGTVSEEVREKVAAWLNRNPEGMCAFLAADEFGNAGDSNGEEV